jgi:hypothetical protein
VLRKPSWIRVRMPSGNAVAQLKSRSCARTLVTVCEEASCPNIHECFSHGTATFMILGEVCTRRCSFCDVAHGRPKPPDAAEPLKLAHTIRDMGLRYVVITSVDRDDLRDGGAAHFAACIREARALSPALKIEILTPDFRGKGRMERALEILAGDPPDVFNHNLETVRALYPNVRPGADYDWSLRLLQRVQAAAPGVADQVRDHARPGRDPRAGRRRAARPARPRRRHGHHRPVPAADAAPPPGAALLDPEEFAELARRRARRWASPTSPRARWCARPTMPTGWPPTPVSWPPAEPPRRTVEPARRNGTKGTRSLHRLRHAGAAQCQGRHAPPRFPRIRHDDAGRSLLLSLVLLPALAAAKPDPGAVTLAPTAQQGEIADWVSELPQQVRIQLQPQAARRRAVRRHLHPLPRCARRRAAVLPGRATSAASSPTARGWTTRSARATCARPSRSTTSTCSASSERTSFARALIAKGEFDLDGDGVYRLKRSEGPWETEARRSMRSGASA